MQDNFFAGWTDYVRSRSHFSSIDCQRRAVGSGVQPSASSNCFPIPGTSARVYSFQLWKPPGSLRQVSIFGCRWLPSLKRAQRSTPI